MTDEEADEKRAVARSGSWMDKAALLLALRSEPRHVQRWGYSTVSGWAAIELGLRERATAQHASLLQWARRVDPLGKRSQELAAMQWTKLRDLRRDATLLPTDLPLPAQRTRGSRERATVREFELDDHASELLGAALARAREISPSEYPAYLLTQVCLDFLATNTFGRPGPDELIRFLVKYELLFHVRLIILSADLEPLYGISHLERLAAAPQFSGCGNRDAHRGTVGV